MTIKLTGLLVLGIAATGCGTYGTYGYVQTSTPRVYVQPTPTYVHTATYAAPVVVRQPAYYAPTYYAPTYAQPAYAAPVVYSAPAYGGYYRTNYTAPAVSGSVHVNFP